MPENHNDHLKNEMQSGEIGRRGLWASQPQRASPPRHAAGAALDIVEIDV